MANKMLSAAYWNCRRLMRQWRKTMIRSQGRHNAETATAAVQSFTAEGELYGPERDRHQRLDVRATRRMWEIVEKLRG